jgi:heat shock protein HslJ
MMSGRNGMMSGLNTNAESASSTMTVTSEEALTLAQTYLDKEYPGYKTATDADPFYGYYTIDITKDGNVTGMLSVNGFNGQVFLHTWHGTFIEMSE